MPLPKYRLTCSHAHALPTIVGTLILILSLSASSQICTNYSMEVKLRVFKDLKTAQKEPEEVFRLNLSGQSFTKLPEAILTFPNLQVLWMDSTGLQEVNWEKGTLKHLVFLSLRGNELTQFTIPAGCLPEIQELYLDDNQLTSFPQVDNSFITIITLSLRHNQITDLPQSTTDWKFLRFLYLDSNPLTHAEQAFALSGNLERLSLYQTGLSTLETPRVQRRLTKLIVSDNLIRFGNWDPEYFPKLAYLDVSYHPNLGDEFWSRVVELPKLRYLVVESAGIQNIPPSIAGLKGLREISLLGNEISQLPQEFFSMNLQLINLEYNPLGDPQKKRLHQVYGSRVHF